MVNFRAALFNRFAVLIFGFCPRNFSVSRFGALPIRSRPRRIMMRIFYRTLLQIAAAALVGCTVGPDYVEPDSELSLDIVSEDRFYRDENLWKEATPADKLPKGDWWSVFNDEILNDLLKLCRDNSPTLASAFYKVEKAREAVNIDAADLYPQANGSAAFTKTERSHNFTGSSTYEKWLLGMGFTWDLDLFGRVRSMIDADTADAQAQLYAYNSLMLSIQTSVAVEYFTLRQYSSEVDLLIRTLDVRRKQTLLVRRRVKLDYANELDLQRALQQEYEAAAQLATLERQIAVSKNRLAILIGVAPSRLMMNDAPLSEVLPKMPAAVPSQLLERRPDIAEAERKVYAANARVGVAQAGFFPTVSISANTDLTANNVDKLIQASSFAWGVSPQIYIPIFQAGRIYAQKRVALAAHKESLEEYKAAVLSAIGEVENALSEINYLEREYDKRTFVTKASLKIQELTLKQYEQGYVDYFSVSDAQRLALENERSQIRLRGDRFRACVALIGALGGGWNVADGEAPEGAKTRAL